MNARICPSCEEPVAEFDRICDVCNTPLRLGSATGILPGAMSPIVVASTIPEPPPALPETSENPILPKSAAENLDLSDSTDAAEKEVTAAVEALASVQPASAPEEAQVVALEPKSPESVASPDEVEEKEALLTESHLEAETDQIQSELDPAPNLHSSVGEAVRPESIPSEDQASDAKEIAAIDSAAFIAPVGSMAAPAATDLAFKPVENSEFQVPPPPGADVVQQRKPAEQGIFGDKPATPEDVAFQIKEETLQTCKRLAGYGYHLYGLFGRPSAGKSSMIYALRQHFLKGDQGFGGYTPEGPEWDDLAKDLEEQWRHNRPIPTKDKLHPYRATSSRGHKHIALLDIAGERFERVQNWTQEIFDFFDLYFDHCKGMFFLVELDDLVGSARVDYGANMRIQAQMARIVSFLAVAGNRDRWRGTGSLAQKQRKLEKALQAKNVKLSIPVSLCLTKADRVGTMNFGPALGRIIPGSPAPESDPWNVLQAVWPEHVESLLNMVPYLKVDWLSCLGTAFEEERQFTQSVGLRGVFQHVVLDPPKAWTLSTKKYLNLQKWLRL